MRTWIHGYRSALTLAGLLIVVALLGALAWQAVAAVRAQRATVESVLEDYAQIAAEQYAAGVALALDYDWFFPVARMVQTFEDGTVEAPGREARVRARTGEVPIDGLLSAYFAARGPEAEIWTAPAWPAPVPEGTVRAVLEIGGRKADENSWPIAAALAGDGEREHLIVFWRAQTADGQSRILEGFEAPLAGFAQVLDPALRAATVLPSTFTDGAESEPVSLRVVSPSGRVLYAKGPPFDPTFSASRRLHERIGGLTVEAAIPPAVAGELVIGGLPRSRLPLIAALLAVAVGLLVGGILLVRQERELMRMRERFVAGASHELRTPLAQIRMFTETLRLDRVRSPEERVRALSILDREARRLSYLVENLLHFSRREAPARPSSVEPVEIGGLAAEVIESFEPLASARHAQLRLIRNGAVPAMIDRDALRQVLLNLLDNASKYGPDGQTIVVTVSTDADAEPLVTVDDEGPGIAPGDRARVWERFWRGADTGGTTGTGIGLSLVRELVESGGGRVEVDDAPGGGARFRVHLLRGS